jgi:2'-5' RNA ligase
MTRAFIALKLPAHVIDALGDLQSALKNQGLKLRWVQPANIHLTLKFLGDVSAEQLQAVKSVIQELSGSQTVFILESKGLGVFPTVKKARVLWSGIHGDVDRLATLQSDLDKALAGIGFVPDNRKFKGHLTLGRVKGRIDGKTLAAAITACGAFASSSWKVERLVLFKSDLKPSGAVYSELFAADLAIGAPEDRSKRPDAGERI